MGKQDMGVSDRGLLQALLDASPEAHVALSSDGVVQFWNRGAEALFGPAPAAAVGRPFAELVSPEGQRAALAALLDAGRTSGEATGEITAYRPDGPPVGQQAGGEVRSTAPTVLHVRSMAGPRAGAGILAVRAQPALPLDSGADARFRALLEAAPDAAVVVRQDGTIALVNGQTERLFGYDRQALVGQSVEMLLPDRFRHSHVADRAGYFGAPRFRPMGLDLALFGRRADGTEFPVEISLSPLETDEGMLASASIRDVTDRHRVEAEIRRLNTKLEARVEERTQRLKALNDELEAFAYSVAHDLRGPLRSLDGFSMLLVSEYADQLDARARDYLSRVRGSSQRMGRLIEGLLELAHLTRAVLKARPLNLAALSAQIVADLHAAEPERQVEVSIPPRLEGRGDPDLVLIALQNLIGNAWKFTSRTPSARIEVGALADAGAVDGQSAGADRVFFVRDNGAGFDMAHRSKLFGAFQRLHSEPEFRGSGIGLATVQRIVERHGGRVWAEGAVGQGATFYFTLGTSTSPDPSLWSQQA